MDNRDLSLFLHLSRTLHFGRTAQECATSPSTLSRTVARIEEEVGAKLLERDQRRVELTPAGRRFQGYASETLERWDAFRSDLESPAEAVGGSISLFCSVTACHSILPRVLSRFREAYPGVRIELETGYAADALGMLERDAVDLTVAAIPDRVGRSIQTHVVTTTQLELVAPASACAVSRAVERDPVDWAEVPIVMPATGLARAAADRWFRRRRVKPRVYGEVAGSDAVLALVSLGCGVGIVPRLVMERSPLRAEVRPLAIDAPVGAFRVGMCTKRRNLEQPAVRAFWDTLQAE